MTLNIDRVDLIIAISVVVIALIACIGLVAWFIKTGRRNKMLKNIDGKISPQQCRYTEHLQEIIKKECRRKEQNQVGHDEINIENEKDTQRDCDAQNGEEEVDVLEEIRQMMMSGDGKDFAKESKTPKNIGKSGKIYSREEIESLIED